jgi:hypothetical protein
VIPDEAVEAVARRNFEVMGDFEWTEAPESLRESCLSEAHKQCEAAAPHLMAAAWDEGWDAAAGWPQIDDNPYRSTT